MINEESNIFFTNSAQNEHKNTRLDKFLSSLPDLNFSRNQIQRLIKTGCVTLEENEIIDCSYKIKVGDSFQIEVPPLVEADPIPQNIPIDIIYEDNDLIVVNKPSGMTVHPAPGAYDKTLVNALLYHCKDNLSGIGGVKRPGIVHRIDKETSGLLVVAKNDKAHIGLSEQFFNHSIERTYFALTYSMLNPLNGTIIGNIARSNFDRKKMALVENGGKHAITHYKTIETFGTFASLVQCNLETGRTHQIRVHLSNKGCALIGDKVYTKNHKSYLKMPESAKKLINAFPRHALHAATLGFVHPVTQKYLKFSSVFPDDFATLLNNLRNL